MTSNSKKRKLNDVDQEANPRKRRKQSILSSFFTTKHNSNSNNSNKNKSNSHNSNEDNSNSHNSNINNQAFADKKPNKTHSPNSKKASKSKTTRNKRTKGDAAKAIQQIESENKQYVLGDDKNKIVVEIWNNKQKNRNYMRCNLCCKYPNIADKGQGKSNIICGMARKEGIVYNFARMDKHFKGTVTNTSHRDVIKHIKYKSEQTKVRNNALEYLAGSEQQKLLLQVRSVFNKILTEQQGAVYHRVLYIMAEEYLAAKSPTLSTQNTVKMHILYSKA